MDDISKSKTDLVRRWNIETVRAILLDETNAAKIASNLLCNPFTSEEVFSWILKEFGGLNKDEWIKAQANYASMQKHPSLFPSASVEGTSRTLRGSLIKLEASDGELRKMICSMVENEPMVNELYSHLFQ